MAEKEAGGPIEEIFGDDLSKFSDESDIETVVTMMTYLLAQLRDIGLPLAQLRYIFPDFHIFLMIFFIFAHLHINKLIYISFFTMN